MESITVHVLLYPSLEIKGDFLAFTSYNILGQGGSLEGAKRSAESVVLNFLDVYADRRVELPRPALKNIREITDLLRDVSSGARIIEDEKRIKEFEDLPKLIFEFYRLDN